MGSAGGGGGVEVRLSAEEAKQRDSEYSVGSV